MFYWIVSWRIEIFLFCLSFDKYVINNKITEIGLSQLTNTLVRKPAT